jgi:ATP/maltotriose-dependent transcriptional regulator MalT
VASSPTVNATVRRLIADRPPRLRLAIASRTSLPVPLAPLRVSWSGSGPNLTPKL